jgi:hypothetical protein
LACGVFFYFIYTPSYIGAEATADALGAPAKDTRTGVSFAQLMYTVGEARMAFAIVGFLGIIVLSLQKIREHFNNYAIQISSYFSSIISLSTLFGWFTMLIVAALAPQFLFININSPRVSNYVLLPASLLAGLGLTWMFLFLSERIQLNKKNKTSVLLPVPYTLARSVFVLLILFIFISGLYDNNQSLNDEPNSTKSTQTYAASQYLSDKISNEDVLLKDHNYITADAWIKLYFTRDYNFPLSRSFFFRYEDTYSDREQCTLLMISSPNTPEGQKCLNDLGVNYIMVNPNFDRGQFIASHQFSLIYESNDIAIFKRTAQ